MKLSKSKQESIKRELREITIERLYLKIQKLEKALAKANECIAFSLRYLNESYPDREKAQGRETGFKEPELCMIEDMEKTKKEIAEIMGER